MVSEGVHSLVDTGNEALLLYGYRRARQRPDPDHPLGHGRELYFWSFIVALLLFALGAGVSILEGVRHLFTAKPIESVTLSYVVLGLSFLFEGASWIVAVRGFHRAKGGLGYWEAVRKSKDPPAFMVLFEDTAALIGIVLAAAGIFAADRLRMPALDGVASILIGLVLAVTAILLARESKGLLIGERADEHLVASILALARSDPAVEGANGVFTVHLSPNQVVAALSIEFSDDLRTPDIEASVRRIEDRIRQRHPEVVALFVKPQTKSSYETGQRRRYGGEV
jgi:cation diffusion facilitator family transporter